VVPKKRETPKKPKEFVHTKGSPLEKVNLQKGKIYSRNTKGAKKTVEKRGTSEKKSQKGNWSTFPPHPFEPKKRGRNISSRPSP